MRTDTETGAFAHKDQDDPWCAKPGTVYALCKEPLYKKAPKGTHPVQINTSKKGFKKIKAPIPYTITVTLCLFLTFDPHFIVCDPFL
jgi:hypothetical protein